MSGEGGCVCGCGGVPARGQFKPGHDASAARGIRALAQTNPGAAAAWAERAGWLLCEGKIIKGPNFACGHPRAGNTRAQNRVCATCWDGSETAILNEKAS